MGLRDPGAAGLDRRGFLRLAGGLGIGLTAAGCATEKSASAPAPAVVPTLAPAGTATPTPAADLLRPGGSAGTIRAHPLQVDLGGRVVNTWGYNGTLPGPEIRVKQGEVLRVRLDNLLTDPTTIHWHGIELPNAMDGVPDVTQPAVGPGGAFTYEFPVPDSGSFMYHAHVGHQLDYGMYGPLVVEEKDSPGGWDREYTLMLDDWRDGLVVPGDPLAEADPQHGEHAGAAVPAPAEAADPAEPQNAGPSMGNRVYPLFLVNGRLANDPATLEVRSGERVRLRVMNIAADTAFRFAIAGHRLTVTHADGFPVEHVAVDTVRLGMGERYDVLVEARTPGAWQVAAVPEAKRGMARAVLRYADAAAPAVPAPESRPEELNRRLLDYADLRYTGEKDFGGSGRAPDRVHDLVITTNRINGRRFPEADPLPVAEGELVRVNMRNDSDLWHPMHLHGHSFRVLNPTGPGAVKDTLSVAADGGTAAFEFLARNPGAWMFHCHNHYHMDNGMARLVTYA